MEQVDIREGARRQHRTIALFAVIQCWMRNLDGIVLERSQLERLLGLKRFKQTRVSWMKADMRELFSYVKPTWTSKPKSFAALYVSRVSLDSFFQLGPMTNKKRLEMMEQKDVKVKGFSMWSTRTAKDIVNAFEGLMPFLAESANYDERLMSAYLALLSQGQISGKSILNVSVSK